MLVLKRIKDLVDWLVHFKTFISWLMSALLHAMQPHMQR